MIFHHAYYLILYETFACLFDTKSEVIQPSEAPLLQKRAKSLQVSNILQLNLLIIK